MKEYQYKKKKNVELLHTILHSSLAIAELKVLHFSLMNNHHRGTETVLLEGGILVGAGLVAVLQFSDNGVAEDAITLAVDEDDATTFLLEVLVHGFAEHT